MSTNRLLQPLIKNFNHPTTNAKLLKSSTTSTQLHHSSSLYLNSPLLINRRSLSVPSRHIKNINNKNNNQNSTSKNSNLNTSRRADEEEILRQTASQHAKQSSNSHPTSFSLSSGKSANSASQLNSSLASSASTSANLDDKKVTPPQTIPIVSPFDNRTVGQKIQDRAVSLPKKVQFHVTKIPEYCKLLAFKSIEISKLLFWALCHPQQSWAKIREGFRHHVSIPFKLMRLDLKVARQIWKDSYGRPFTELEKKKLQAIGADFLRFVPFAFFLAVPALELLLPVYLYMFPNAKPGWFESRQDKDIRSRRKLETRVEMAKYLKATLETYELKKSKQATTSLSQFKVLHKKLNIKKELEVEELVKYVPLFNTHLRWVDEK